MNNTNTANAFDHARPTFTLYHANAKGTGSALRMQIVPADLSSDGGLLLRLAPQKTVGDARGPHPTCATFDWENAIALTLGFDDLTRLLQVFRGETESVNDYHGLFHRDDDHDTIVRFEHVIEPFGQYRLELYRTDRAPGGTDRCAAFSFSAAEALGISVALEDSLGAICFG